MFGNFKYQFLIAAIIFLFGIFLIFKGLQTNSANIDYNFQTPLPSFSTPNSAAILGSGFEKGTVSRVIDGDTIVVNLAGRDQTVRYIGINTPETVDPKKPVQCFGKEASDEDKALMDGKTVYMAKDITDTDKYNRLLRYVYIQSDSNNLLFVNDFLIRTGFAVIDTFPPNTKYVARFQQAQDSAKSANLGLWAKCPNTNF